MDFKLPDIGEGVHEGEITKWLVKQGDAIKEDQPMVEVMTDKATVEIPSPVNGTVEKLVASEGDTIEVGKVMIVIAESGKGAAKGAAPASKPAEDKPAPKAAAPVKAAAKAAAPEIKPAVAPAKAAPAPASKEIEAIPFEILATPATRQLARDLSVDLRDVKATGPHGRITKEDVKNAGDANSTARPEGAPKALVALRGTVQKIPLRGVRRKIAEAMAHSKHTAAHFTYVEEVDMTKIVELRKMAADEAKKRNTKLTFLPFIIKALIPALQEFPMLNASLDDEAQEILVKGDYNIGIATDTPQGLMVPVIKGADRKSVWELATEIAEISERAKTGKSLREDFMGGTFTLTNAGSIGGVFTTPVINHPEVAILGINAIRKRPVVDGDKIVIRDMMFLSMSVDHRVVDGADAARFVNRLVYFLSEPTRLVFA